MRKQILYTFNNIEEREYEKDCVWEKRIHRNREKMLEIERDTETWTKRDWERYRDMNKERDSDRVIQKQLVIQWVYKFYGYTEYR